MLHFIKIFHTLQEVLKFLADNKTLIVEIREMQKITLELHKNQSLSDLEDQKSSITVGLMDNSDIKNVFNICDRTISRWRKKDLIKSSLIGGKHFYLKSDIEKLIASGKNKK